jgi:hypothetical protein
MTNVLGKILPKEINNEFLGYKMSLYGFLIVIIFAILEPKRTG